MTSLPQPKIPTAPPPPPIDACHSSGGDARLPSIPCEPPPPYSRYPEHTCSTPPPPYSPHRTVPEIPRLPPTDTDLPVTKSRGSKWTVKRGMWFAGWVLFFPVFALIHVLRESPVDEDDYREDPFYPCCAPRR